VPEKPEFTKQYNDGQKAVLSVRPGIIGAYYFFENMFELSQAGVDLNLKQKYIEHVLPQKLKRELQYVEDRRIVRDLVIVLKSIRSRLKKVYLSDIKNEIQSYNLFVSLDLILIFFSYFLSYHLRFDWSLSSKDYQTFLISLPIIMAIRVFMFDRHGMYKSIWKYVSVRDLLKIIRATTIGTILIVASLYLLGLTGVPRSVLLIDLVFCIFFIGGFRLIIRVFRENVSFEDKSGKNVLIIGAGDVGEMLLRELDRNPENKYNVVGFVDDNKEKHGLTVHGVRILGGRENIPGLVGLFRVDEVLIAISSIAANEIKSIIKYCRAANVRHRIVPAVNDLLNGGVRLSRSRNIEISDIFGRKPVKLNISAIKNALEGKRIMLTGAGGSIGSELCRQIAEYGPSSLVLVDKNENYLEEIRSELRHSYDGMKIHACLSDITHKEKQRALFSKYIPEIIFHAAAQKHVPLSQENPDEAIWANVYGTKVVADLAAEYLATHFVLISTDKAVNPTSIMGVTKRIAELYVQALDTEKGTKFFSVRFGNVFNSNGSVVPSFVKQIERGGPIMVMHPDIERYFMSIDEAVQLILQSITMSENGQIFLLDMGKSIKIVDLAEELVYYMGAKPHEDIEIKYIGLRPGEKMYEELINPHESATATPHSNIRALETNVLYTIDRLERHISELLVIANKLEYDDLVKKLKEIVPEYVPSSTDKAHRLENAMAEEKKVVHG
jgi:FlaA1/EpsC-like NDP-sugar epimerase